MASTGPAAVPLAEFGIELNRVRRLFARINDHRDPRGVRHKLEALLTLITVGLAAGKSSFAQIAAFGKRRPKLIKALGFRYAPSHTTIWRTACKVDPAAVRAVLQEIGRATLAGMYDLAMAIDGKRMRGSESESGKQTEIVMATEHTTGVILDADVVPKGGSELVVGRRMAKALAAGSRVAVITGDALHTDRNTARAIRKGRTDYVFKLKKEPPICA